MDYVHLHHRLIESKELLVAGGGAAATTAPLLTWRFPLYPGPSHRRTTSHIIEALPSQKVLALLVAFVLCLGAFVLSAREAQAEQKSTNAHQPTMATDSGPPLVPQAEQPPPVQTPAFETALPKTPPPTLTESVVAPQLGPLPSTANVPSPVTPPAATPPPEAPPAVSVHGGDAISSVDQPIRDRSPVSDKPSTPPTTGGNGGEDDSSAPIPNNKKEEAKEPLLSRTVDRQQAASTPVSLPIDPKNNQASRASSEPVAGGPLNDPSALSKEEVAEKNKDPLSPPLKQEEKKPSVLLWATSDGSGAQAQRLPKAQEAALEAPTRAILLPLGVSPAANDTITAAAVPIDHPGASTATSASILWKGAPVGVGSARDLPTPHPKPSGSIVAAIDNAVHHAVHQQLVSDLASSHESPLTGRQIPSEGTPPASQPSSPPVPFEPWHQDSFGLSGGGSISSSTGGIGPLLLLGILALGGYFLLRPYSRTYLASCELPKLSSALPTPLERPG